MTRDRYSIILRQPPKVSQAELEGATEALGDALAEGDEVSIAIDLSHYETHDQLVGLLGTRRTAIQTIEDLMSELDAAPDEAIGTLPPSRPVPQLRKAIPAARVALCQETWVAAHERTLRVVRVPWARIKVETAACQDMLDSYTAGKQGRVRAYAEGVNVSMERAVHAAMVPLMIAITALQAALDHAADEGAIAPAGPPREREATHRAALDTIEEARVAHAAFTEAHLHLELNKMEVHRVRAKVFAGKFGLRNELKRVGNAMLDAIVLNIRRDEPPLPNSYLNDAREVIRPLYQNQLDKFGNQTMAPVLFEHRDLMQHINKLGSTRLDTSTWQRSSAVQDRATYRELIDEEQNSTFLANLPRERRRSYETEEKALL